MFSELIIRSARRPGNSALDEDWGAPPGTIQKCQICNIQSDLVVSDLRRSMHDSDEIEHQGGAGIPPFRCMLRDDFG